MKFRVPSCWDDLLILGLMCSVAIKNYQKHNLPRREPLAQTWLLLGPGDQWWADPCLKLMGWWERAFCLWPSDHRVSHLWACPPVKLMESHTLGKGRKIHGVDSLLLCPFLNKANMARYYVASRRGWCLGQSQEGSPRLLKMEAHCSLIFVKMPGRDTKIFRGYLYVFFPGLSYQKVCLPNPMISEKQQLLDFSVLTWVLVHFGVSRAAWDTWAISNPFPFRADPERCSGSLHFYFKLQPLSHQLSPALIIFFFETVLNSDILGPNALFYPVSTAMNVSFRQDP